MYSLRRLLPTAAGRLQLPLDIHCLKLRGRRRLRPWCRRRASAIDDELRVVVGNTGSERHRLGREQLLLRLVRRRWLSQGGRELCRNGVVCPGGSSASHGRYSTIVVIQS